VCGIFKIPETICGDMNTQLTFPEIPIVFGPYPLHRPFLKEGICTGLEGGPSLGLLTLLRVRVWTEGKNKFIVFTFTETGYS
jgi:hypothetical protein